MVTIRQSKRPSVKIYYVQELPGYLDFEPTQLARSYRQKQEITSRIPEILREGREDFICRMQRQEPMFTTPYAALAQGRNDRTLICVVNEAQQVSGYMGMSKEGFFGQEDAIETLQRTQRMRGFASIVEFITPEEEALPPELLPERVLAGLSTLWNIERETIRLQAARRPKKLRAESR